MKRRLEWTRRSWLYLGAATLLAAGAGAGIRNQSESVAALDRETAVTTTATAAPAAAQSTAVESTGVGETLPSSSSSSVGASLAPITASGVRAFIDPATGRLTANPTREQLARSALQARASSSSRSVVGLRTFELSRGGRGLDLQGRFHTALRVERGEDGNFYQTCGDPGHDREPHSHADDSTTHDGRAPRRGQQAPVR